ncbi:conserved domain protein [Prevotella sp. CAG:1092]|nr:conserved domain protein [Prevotella sp. CAG:1092]
MIKMFAKIRGWFNFVHQTVNNYSNTLLMPMNDFIKSYSTNGITYISFPKFAEIKHQILTEPYRLIQFMGLSGIGKSRMIFEIFHGIDNSNNYYCSNASDDRLLNELSTFLRERMNEEGVIVLDDCNGDAFSKISKLRLEINTKYKIIGIYNDTEDIVRERGVNQLYLNRRDLLDSVNQYIQDQIGLLGNQAENIVRQIQDISDGFPVVAIKAIQSYRENGVTNLMNEDELWKKMCGYQSLTVDERVALQSLSLFEPLGYEQEFARDYQMVKYNENITPFDYNHLKIDDIFEKLVKSYKNKELIEINSCWLLVRPLPLAVWLVGQWFRNCGQNRFVQVLNDLDAIQEQAQANRMKRALCKRIQNMQDNEKAKYLFERLMAVGAPFHYEEVVCSDFGSQLFLAISTVNPVAVTNSLYDVVMPQSIDWTKNIKGDVRRNYIWCLERLSMPETTFRKAALLLAKFSLAENESWANNATGQLLQLFHVALSGTETTLRQRLDVIEELRTLGDEYIPIVLKVIDSAFSYSHFSRNAGYEHIDGKVYTDFEPMGVDICEYWEGCIKILGELLQYRPDSVNQIADIIVSHVYDLSLRSGCYDYLEKLINMVVNARGNEWPEMHKQLLKLKRYNQDRLSTERKAKIDGWLKLFGAKDFLLTLDEVHATFYADNRELSFEDKMAHAVEYFTPIAKRFRDEKLYSDSELVLRLLDSQTNEIAFIRAISNVLTLQQVKELFDVIIKNIAGKAQDYQSSFLNILYFSLSESEAKRKFLQSIYDLKKYQQYIVLKTNSETSDLKVLKEVVDIINNKHISPKTSLRQYLYRVNIDSSERMFEVCSYIRKNVGNSDDILLDYIVANEFSSFILEGEMKTLTMELLLNYDYAKSTVDAYNVNSLVTNILESGKEVDFAISYNKKLLREMKDYDSFRVNEHLYYTLLPKYQDSILGDILKEISNRESDFWYFGGKDLGSGDGFGVGPLFQCNIETIKEVCLQESQGCLPYRLAYLAPVFDYSDKDEPSFSQFFYWLLEHFDSFKEQEKIMSEFSSNMGSYSWVGSIIPLLEKKINCFKKLEHHTNTIVKKWVIENILSLSEQLRKEQNSESYRKLC